MNTIQNRIIKLETRYLVDFIKGKSRCKPFYLLLLLLIVAINNNTSIILGNLAGVKALHVITWNVFLLIKMHSSLDVIDQYDLLKAFRVPLCSHKTVQTKAIVS